MAMKKQYRIFVEERGFAERRIRPIFKEDCLLDTENEAIQKIEKLLEEFPIETYFIIPQYTKA